MVCTDFVRADFLGHFPGSEIVKNMNDFKW
jgi:hypothetical protein